MFLWFSIRVSPGSLRQVIESIVAFGDYLLRPRTATQGQLGSTVCYSSLSWALDVSRQCRKAPWWDTLVVGVEHYESHGVSLCQAQVAADRDAGADAIVDSSER